MKKSDPGNLLTQARWAVIAFFASNGFIYANWTARLPEIEAFYDMTHTQLGGILLSSAIGSIIAMPIAGYLNNQYGSKWVTIISAAMVTVIVPWLVFTPSLVLVYGTALVLGMMAGSMDVSMNGQAVIVERRLSKSIMSSFHATFSIGMVIGAGAGALAAQLSIPLFTHMIAAAIFTLVVIVIASRYLIDDFQEARLSSEKGSGFVLPTAAILPVALIAFCGMTGEGSLIDWSALYMNEVVGASESLSAIAYGTFGGAMTIGRLLGDRYTDRYGQYKMLLYTSILAFIGLSLALLFPYQGMTFLGFFITGIGLSNIVPIAYSIAGNTPNVKPAVGIAMATTIGYSGFFIGPPVIGFLADTFDLRWALCFTLILFMVMIVLVMRRKISP